MRFLRFLGRSLKTILIEIPSFLFRVVLGLARELLAIARVAVVFVPMALLLLFVFMFFQESLSLEQADTLGFLIGIFVLGNISGILFHRRVERFWQKK